MFRDYDDAGELILRCAGCNDEIEPGTVEFCEYCKTATHGGECLADHLESCTVAAKLPPRIPVTSDMRKVARKEPHKRTL
jgi:hypothetical protein